MTNIETTHKSTIEWIPLSSIKTDPRVNTRPVDQNWVERKLTEGFDLDKLGTPVVSARTGNTFVWLDGQHRGDLAIRAGFGDERIEVRVFHDLSIAEEAALFIGLNDNRRVQSIYKFLARVTAKEPTAVAITKMAKAYGWRIVLSGSVGCIPAASSLDAVYAKGPWVLSRVLYIITNAWDHEIGAVEGSLLRGLGLAIHRYGDDLSPERMATALKHYKGGPDRFLGDAKSLRDALGGTVATAVTMKAVQAYNKGLKPANRLEV